MPRTCTVCTHPKRAEIDRHLLAGETSNRRIASQYDVTERAIRSHKANHLSERMAVVAERNAEADVRTAIDIVTQLKVINNAALRVLKDARDAGDGALTLQATDRILKQIETQAKLIDLIQDGTTVNVTVSPEWQQIRAMLLTTLRQHPDALRDVTTALQAIEGGRHGRVA